MKDLEYYLKKAKKEKWAIGQFNFSDLSQLEGIVEAAKKLKSPVIIGTSEGESRFLGLKQANALKEAYKSETALPIFLNLDHGKSFEYLEKAVKAGYDMIHFDGSKLSLKDNVSKTKEVVRCAKKAGVLTEGEVGVIGTDSSRLYQEKFVLRPEDLTNPKEAGQYIKDTGVQCLAVSIGNLHGISIKGNPKLDADLLRKIRKATKNSFLVLHGGSGIKNQDIKKAIKLGIVKININTELRLAYTKTLKQVLRSDSGESTPYKYLPSAVKAVQKVVEEKILLFGSKNKV